MQITSSCKNIILLHYYIKITRIRHEKVKRFGKDIDINSKIKEFYVELKIYKLENMICIDETIVKTL